MEKMFVEFEVFVNVNMVVFMVFEDLLVFVVLLIDGFVFGGGNELVLVMYYCFVM